MSARAIRPGVASWPSRRRVTHDPATLTTGATTGTDRETNRVRERIARIGDDLKRVRATERVLAEQVAYLAEVAADAETRKLVAQTPLADREWQQARTDLDRHAGLLDEARQQAQALIDKRDGLLERLFELEAARPGRDHT